MNDLDINFPLDKFEKLIIDIGWESLDDWFNFWNNQKEIISIDDLYLPSNEMKLANQNNPWNVSRGFPGSHSVKLMHEKLF